MRILSRYIPNISLALAVLDIACLALLQGPLILGIRSRLSLSGAAEALLVVALGLGITVTLLFAAGAYRRDLILGRSGATEKMTAALGFATLLLALVFHLGLGTLWPDEPAFRSLSRASTIAVLQAGASMVGLTISRSLGEWMIAQHWFRRRVLIVGTGQRAAHLKEILEAGGHDKALQTLFVTERILRRAEPQPVALEAVAVQAALPECGSLGTLVAEEQIDEIVLAADERRGLALEDVLDCRVGGVAVTDFPSFLERETGRVDLRWLDTSWLIYAPGFQMGPLDRGVKRLIDILTSLVGLISLAPLLGVVAVTIKLDSPGPVLYRQQRVTRHGRVFWLYKLRTMRADAEANGAVWAARRDARITRMGALLRRTRIDEVPQLLNVLIGDMSLVGPRPERPIFTEQLARTIPLYDLRHAVKSGLTGWTQINYPYGASVEDARAKLEYDLYYVKNYTLLRDILIILQTLRVVLFGEGVR